MIMHTPHVFQACYWRDSLGLKLLLFVVAIIRSGSGIGCSVYEMKIGVSEMGGGNVNPRLDPVLSSRMVGCVD